MRAAATVLSFALLTADSGLIAADTEPKSVYKSTLPGNDVVYTVAPVPDAVANERITLTPGPTKAQIDEARRAGESISRLADQLQTERLAREATARARREAAQTRAEHENQAALAARIKQQQFILREYYGYRDYRFPSIPPPQATLQNLPPTGR